MSGRGKGGKGLGKGAAKRHRKSSTQSNKLTKPSIRRLARRGGVKRLSGRVYDEADKITIQYLEVVLKHAVTYAQHSKRRTVNVNDMLHALKRVGTRMIGW
ncbi:Transcription factor CBF/NF-Y/archaeal histone domain [Trinorchestia longiramus]|nr:Transcription factor CBF/NF-Y/archaeal histone domain [Trinorchestia longiramus]